VRRHEGQSGVNHSVNAACPPDNDLFKFSDRLNCPIIKIVTLCQLLRCEQARARARPAAVYSGLILCFDQVTMYDLIDVVYLLYPSVSNIAIVLIVSVAFVSTGAVRWRPQAPSPCTSEA
jgi:hypothetical protein